MEREILSSTELVPKKIFCRGRPVSTAMVLLIANFKF